MTSVAIAFVDTNVLLYAHDATDLRKQALAVALLDRLWEQRSGTLSTQILQEFYVVATRRFSPPLSRQEARRVVALYSTWPCIQVDPPLILDASALDERHQLSFWDALVVEASRRA